MTTYKVLLVDDHPLIRSAMAQLLNYEDEFEVLDQASNGSDAIAKAHETNFDLILLDLNMKEMSGLDTLKALRADGCNADIVIFTVSDNINDINTVMRNGANGYLLKDSEPEELISLLKQLKNKHNIYSSDIIASLEIQKKQFSVFDQLTHREVQVLKKVSQGLRNKEIAKLLFISEATVKVHIKSLMKKLNIQSRTAATLIYLENFNEN